MAVDLNFGNQPRNTQTNKQTNNPTTQQFVKSI